MEEIWKGINGYPGYEISNLGRVVSHKGKADRILIPKKCKSGYLSVALCKNGQRKDCMIHRLVLSAFNPIDNMEKYEVNHLDEDKHNNCLTNLEWSTSKDNCNYGIRNTKIKVARSVKVRCIETGIVYDSGKEAALLTNTCRSSISNCLRGRISKAGGYHWEVAL